MKKFTKLLTLASTILLLAVSLSTANAQSSGKDTPLILPKKQTAGTMQVYYLDIGQGDSTYIETAYGDHILIDGGKNNKGKDVVAYLKHLGVTAIDIMIATHPDADHIGGLDDVLNAFPVKAVYAPKVAHTTDTYRDFLTAVKNQKLTIKSVKAGVIIPLTGVTATFVAPVKDYGKDLNDWSAVLHLTYNTTSFLFTGDAELKSEKDMIASGFDIKADVLKVGHHGANTSSSTAFIKAVSPKYAIISVGKNSYGHPTEETLKRLNDANTTIYRTDQKGTITAISDGKKITFQTVR